MTTSLDIAALASAILYPLVFLTIIFLFRKEIPAFLKGISGRLTGIAFAGISLELAKAEAFSPKWEVDGTLDLRHNAKAENVNDSTAGNFSALLNSGGSVDYVVINLGQGKEWLASRLFIMSIIFERMKGIKGVVFLETTKNTRKKFVGWATPDKVRWVLAERFPWFESAYLASYTQILEQGSKVVDNQGRLGYSFDLHSSGSSISLLEKFLQKIQSPPENGPFPDQEKEWITLPSDLLNSTPTQEHTNWLNAEKLEDLLSDDLITESIFKENISPPEINKQIKQRLMASHAFIAVVKVDNQFDYLVKSEKLLDQLLRD